MAEPNTGTDKQEMKRLLLKSKSEPVNCAIGTGKDPSVALLLLDKVKQPKGLEMELRKQFPETKTSLFGSAMVDVDIDPKEVRFTVNKEAAGIARKLVKTLRGTGYTKALIVDEDGKVLEKAGAEDEAEAQGLETEETATPPTAGTAPTPPPQAPQPDAGALGRALAEQIKRIPAVLATAPAMKAQLGQLANDANTGLKANNLVAAAANIEALRRALDGAAAPPTTGAAPAKATYDKMRLAWITARKRVETDIEKLRGEIVATYKDDGSAPELDRLYRARTAPLLSTLDLRLADTLEQAGSAGDAAQHAKLVTEAKAIIGEYEAYVAGEKLIADLDDNPFVPLTIKTTVSATLAVVAKAVV